MIGAAPWLLFTYLAAPLALFSAFLALRKPADEGAEDPLSLLLAAVGIGPLLIAWLLNLLLSLAPGQADALYRWGVVGAFGLLAPLLLARGRALRAGWAATGRALRGLRLAEHPWAVLVALVCVYQLIGVCAAAAQSPFSGNDALEYATVARIVARRHEVSFYVFGPADPQSGFHTHMTHPLGYVLLIYWSYLCQGSAELFGFAKLIPCWATGLSALLIGYGLGRRRPLTGAIAVALLLASPLWLKLVSELHHIDPLQGAAVFLSLFCLERALRRATRLWIAVAGLSLGLCMFVHSVGILALPLGAAAWLLLSRGPLKARLLRGVGIAALALLIGGQQFVENQRERGRPVGDSNPIWELEQLGVQDWFRRRQGQQTLATRLVNGAGRCWSEPGRFGLAPWLALLGLASLWQRRREERGVCALCGVYLVLFYDLVFGTVLIGNDLIVRSPRYFVFLIPLFACLGALGVERFLPPPGSWGNATWTRTLALLVGGFLLLNALPAWKAWAAIGPALTHPSYDLEARRERGDPVVAVLDHVRAHAPADAVLLTWHKGDFGYYAQRKILADLDPRLLETYRTSDVLEARRRLRELGVHYICAPPSEQPTFHASVLARLTQRPDLCELRLEHEGWRLYRLRSQ